MKLTSLFALFILLIISIQGCTVQKQLIPTGGSRADGIVKLSFEHGKYEIPQINYRHGLNAAKERCAAWGYLGAEAFGGSTRICNDFSGGSCNSWLVTYEYQCVGTGTPNAEQQ